LLKIIQFKIKNKNFKTSIFAKNATYYFLPKVQNETSKMKEPITKEQARDRVIKRMSIIAKNVKRIRFEKGWNRVTPLAHMMETSEGQIRDIEAGRCKSITLITLERLSYALDTTICDLLTEKNLSELPTTLKGRGF